MQKIVFGKYVGYISKHSFPSLHRRKRGQVFDVVSMDELTECRPYSWKTGTLKFLTSVAQFHPNGAL
jgi:hypothetical protein